MKKIVAALGTLLFVGGIKAQPTIVRKTTTSQVRSNTRASANNASIKIGKKNSSGPPVVAPHPLKIN